MRKSTTKTVGAGVLALLAQISLTSTSQAQSCDFFGGVYEVTNDCGSRQEYDPLNLGNGSLPSKNTAFPRDNGHAGSLWPNQRYNKVVIQQAHSSRGGLRNAAPCSYVVLDHTYDNTATHPLMYLGVRAHITTTKRDLKTRSGEVIPLKDDPESIKDAWEKIYHMDFKRLKNILPASVNGSGITGKRYATFDDKGSLIVVSASHSYPNTNSWRERHMWIFRKKGRNIEVENHRRRENVSIQSQNSGRCVLRQIDQSPRFLNPEENLPAVVKGNNAKLHHINADGTVSNRTKSVLFEKEIVTVLDPSLLNWAPAPEGWAWVRQNDTAISMYDVQKILDGRESNETLNKHQAIGLVELDKLSWPYQPR